MVVEVQQVESRIYWYGFGFHQDFYLGTVHMGRMQTVVIAPKNPFLRSSVAPLLRLSYVLQYVGLAGNRTHGVASYFCHRSPY